MSSKSEDQKSKKSPIIEYDMEQTNCDCCGRYVKHFRHWSVSKGVEYALCRKCGTFMLGMRMATRYGKK